MFHLHGNGTEWLGEGLPTPSYLEHINRGYLIAYQLDGYFGTSKGSKYLNDIIARFLITFKDQKPERLPYKPKMYSDVAHYYPKIYRLKELRKLKSLKKYIKAPVRADSFDDHIFWVIKLYCEDLIRLQGLVSYQQLEDFAYWNFEDKEHSTLRAKCRSIFNWYETKDWKLPFQRKTKDDKELKMTRQERAIANTKAREEKARAKVINTIKGLMAETYKKKSGSWNVTKIAEDINLDRRTVTKYINS